MIKSYLISAWRAILKNRLFSVINIVGLSLSMALSMIVMMHVLDTVRYDRFHPDRERIYRIITDVRSSNGNEWMLASTSLPLKGVLESDLPRGADVAQLYPAIHHRLVDAAKEIPVSGAFTQPSFFDVFGFTLASGNAKTALSGPNKIVLTDATARKFFATDNAVGKILTLNDLGTFEVTGVLREPANKSHIHYDVFVSAETIANLENAGKLRKVSDKWDSFELGYTYVKLPENVRKDQLEEALQRINGTINHDSNQGSLMFRTQQLADITPGTESLYNDIGSGSTWGKLLAEGGIALIILISACFNYTNLSIARALTRAREVGVRKIAGATRSQIFIQYVMESVLVALLALCMAEFMLAFIIEYDLFNEGYEFVPHIPIDATLMMLFVAFALFAGILAGVLPATLLSSFRPSRLLRNVGVEKVMGALTVRKALLIFQFGLSMVIIIFLTVFDRQFEYMADADPGFRIDDVVTIPVTSREVENLANIFSQVPGVQSIGKSSGSFGRYVTGNTNLSVAKNDPQAFRVDYYFADEEMITVSGLKVIAGTPFNVGNNVHRESGIVVNEKTLSILGFKTAWDAVGQSVFIDDTIAVTITAVLRDFYHQGVGNAIRPLMLRKHQASFSQLNILISAGTNRDDAQKNLETLWKKVFPDAPFTCQWMREDHNRRYAEMGSVSLLGFLGFMTIAIASLGLLGLVVYTVETRRKEISIRKVAGASVYQITQLLSRGFAKLLLIAACVALPLGYVLSELFLMNFANRVPVGMTTLLTTFVFLLVVGLVTIGSQTINAARQNPVRYLRNE